MNLTSSAVTVPPVALTIAGSDSGGGAGVQADLKTFEAFGVFGTSAITAVTAQNTVGVHSVLPMTGDLVTAQILAVVTDLAPSAVKTGMLATADIAATVAAAISDLDISPVVVDPVMVSTGGDRLLDEDALDVIRSRLLPVATLVTPNLAEAGLLTGLDVRDRRQMSKAARCLVEAGASAALVKGGHLAGDEIVDVLWDGESETVWEARRLPGGNTHGTGCTLSAAITAGLAAGSALIPAISEAIAYTRRAIASAPGLGQGPGPLDHRGAAGTTRHRAPRCS
ncbi:MAG: bifunctional hydroxymethylpyrimidine kinase/phosphomethylpyrimidine kinase [Gemmatimonadota bacterium]